MPDGLRQRGAAAAQAVPAYGDGLQSENSEDGQGFDALESARPCAGARGAAGSRTRALTCTPDACFPGTGARLSHAPHNADYALRRRSVEDGGALLRGLGGDPPRRAVDTDALVRREYWKRIATQVFLANLASTLHYIGGSVLLALRVGSPLRWTLLELQKLLCGLLSAGLLTLCTLQRLNGSLPVRWRSDPGTILKRLLTLEFVTYAVINVGGIYEYMSLTENCPAGASFATCGQRYLSSFHCAIALKWISTQVTGRRIFPIELFRNAAVAVCLIALAASDGSLTPLLAAVVLLEAAASFLYTMVSIKLCRALLIFEDRHLPVLDTCPGFLKAWRERVIRRLEEFVLWLLDEPVLDANCVAGLSVGAVLVCRFYGDESLHSISIAITTIFLSLMTAALISKKAAGTIRGMQLMARRLGLGAEQRLLFALRAQLSTLPTESAILCAASAALMELLPGTVATAVAVFEDDENSVADAGRVALIEVSGEQRAAMDAAISAGSARGTSAAFVCYQAPARGSQHAVAWSGDFPSGLNAFSDWRAASRAGLTGQAVTVPLSAGPVMVGFVMAHFAASLHSGSETSVPSEQLLELCEIVGSAIFCVRAQQALSTSQSIINDVFPQHIARELEKRAREESAPAAAPGDSAADDALSTRLRTVDESPASQNPARISEHKSLFAETYPAVTIIFADVVGFTAFSAARSPESVMAMLNNLFSRFDDLCAQHSVYKVETIGDCFMAVAGLLPRRADHAPAALRFALDMLAQAALVDVDDAEGRKVQLRVGLHAGPVTAGLIGKTRARYCLFGDSVNTASRMESTGVPGSIQLSAETARLLDVPLALLEPRLVQVKGRGQMSTFLLEASSANGEEVRRHLGPPLPLREA